MNQDSQLRERDNLLEDTLFGIAHNPKLNKKLIFQGGGALHFIYSSPRYSTDLDFVCPTLGQDSTEIKAELVRIGEGNLRSRVAKDNPDILRVTYALALNQPVAKVEVYSQVAEEYDQTKGKFRPLLVETPNEIFADKIVASLERMNAKGTLKPTDLFDLNFLSGNLDIRVDPGRLERKSQAYGNRGWNRANVQKVVGYIRNPSNHAEFRRIISKSLMADFEANKTMDRRFFEQAAQYFLPLLSI